MDTFQQLLQETANKDASDLFLNEGAKPTIKIGSRYKTIATEPLQADQIEKMIRSQLSAQEWETLATKKGLDIGRDLEGVGRFRINVYFQKRSLALVARYVKNKIPPLETLGFPDSMQSLALSERGIILIAGETGVGKSTTLASLIDYRNRHRSGHIITIEDPIEYVHQHKKSLISQREIGIDTYSYSDALMYALREAPDTVVIGEIRDESVAEHALRLAETGHLCLATLHATSANLAVERFLNFFPHSEGHLRKELASHLNAIISQRMGVGVIEPRVMVPEILINTPQISDCIDKGEFSSIKQAMTDNGEGCITFDESLFEKVRKGELPLEEALRLSDSRINLSLKLQTEGLKNETSNKNHSDTSTSSSNKYDSMDLDIGWEPPDENSHKADFLHVEKMWLSEKINISSLQYWAIVAHPRCSQINRNLEALITQALGFTLKQKGFSINTHMCDAVIHFAFTPPQSETNNTDPKSVNSTITKTQLVLQAKYVTKDQVFWRGTTYFVADINCLTFQEFQSAFSDLMKTWPSLLQTKKTG